MSRKTPFTRVNMLIAVVAALAAGALGATPALADTELGHTGTVGFHQLIDDSDRAGARCTYKERTPGLYDWEGELKHIDVRPPRMRAASGTQRVGWRFIIERRAFGDTAGPSRIVYRSSVQTARTNTTTDAAFARMGVDVNVPTDNANQSPEYLYRVRVKMFWYDPAGNLTGSANHGVDWYRFVELDTYNDESPCRGWMAWIIN